MRALPLQRHFLMPASFFPFSKMEKVFTTIMLGAFVGDLILFFYFINLIFLSNTAFITPTPALAMTTSPGLEQLIEGLQKNGISPLLGQEVTRPHISVVGETIMLGGDNIQVFQYEDATTAISEATKLVNRYATGTRSILWKNKIHVYANNSIVIFYLGDNQSILGALDQDTDISEMK